MPNKKNEITQAERSATFETAARDLVDAGELNPAEAGERFERVINKVVHHSDDSA